MSSALPFAPLSVASAVETFDVSTPGWSLHEGGPEPRSVTAAIRFVTPYTRPPVVQVALAGFDVDNAVSARLRITAEAIGAEGFTVRLETWEHTKIYAVSVSWLAIG